MPRTKAVFQSQYPYHITGRSINKERFQIPLDEVWKIMSIQLTYVNWIFKAQIHSFVLMPNHFHLMLTTPNADLDIIMANFMKETSRQINEYSGRINQAYGARHFRCVIESEHYFLHAYKYIYSNPVHAGISARCEDYQYSSLAFKLGKTKADFPVLEDNLLFPNYVKTLNWLNQKPSDSDWKSISDAMKKSKFKIANSRMTNKKSHLEFDML